MKERKRRRCAAKAPEKRHHWESLRYLLGRKPLAVEFFDDESRSTTTWFKGTVIAYSRRGYVVTFDGCGPEETIKSLKDSIQTGILFSLYR